MRLLYELNIYLKKVIYNLLSLKKSYIIRQIKKGEMNMKSSKIYYAALLFTMACNIVNMILYIVFIRLFV